MPAWRPSLHAVPAPLGSLAVSRALVRWCTRLLCLALVTVAWPALAGESRIAVAVSGAMARELRDRIVETVPDGVTVIDDAAFTGALARAGLPGGRMGHALVTPSVRPAFFKIVRRAIKSQELAGAVLARVKPGRKGSELVLVYLEQEGEPLLDTAVPVRGNDDELRSELQSALTPVWNKLAPPPPPPPPPEPVASAVDAEAEPDEGPAFEPHRPGSELFSVALDFELSGRFFGYSEGASPETVLWPYDTFGAPTVQLAAELYPAATTDVPFVRDLGLTFSVMHVMGWESVSEDDRYRLSPDWTRLWAGLRYRIRTAEADQNPAIFGLGARVGLFTFGLDAVDAASEVMAAQAPSVSYVVLSAGLDARLPLGERVALLPALAYVGPLEGGELFDRFSDVSLAAVDASFALAVVIGLGFEARAGLEYTGFFSSFGPAPGTAMAVEGASDHFLAVRFGIAQLF